MVMHQIYIYIFFKYILHRNTYRWSLFIIIYLLLVMCKGLDIISFRHGMESFYNKFHPLSGVLWSLFSLNIGIFLNHSLFCGLSFRLQQLVGMAMSWEYIPYQVTIRYLLGLQCKNSAISWSLPSSHRKHRSSFPCTWAYPEW